MNVVGIKHGTPSVWLKTKIAGRWVPVRFNTEAQALRWVRRRMPWLENVRVRVFR